MGEHIFARIRISFSDCIMIQKRWTVVDSLPKWQLSGAIRKIWDSFPPAIRSLTFDETLNFSLRVDHVGPERSRVQLALHNENRSSLCRILTVGPPGGGILIWSNRWASYPLLNA